MLRRLLILVLTRPSTPPPWAAAVVAADAVLGLVLVLVVAPVRVAALTDRGRAVGTRREVERGELDSLPHCQLAGGEIDGAAAVALNAGHPELALLNFFTGSTQANLFSPTQV